MAVLAIYTYRGDPTELRSMYDRVRGARAGSATAEKAPGGIAYFAALGDDCIKIAHVHQTEEQERHWLQGQDESGELKKFGFDAEAMSVEREVFQVYDYALG